MKTGVKKGRNKTRKQKRRGNQKGGNQEGVALISAILACAKEKEKRKDEGKKNREEEDDCEEAVLQMMEEYSKYPEFQEIIEFQDEFGNTAFFYAYENEMFKVAKKLLEMGKIRLFNDFCDVYFYKNKEYKGTIEFPKEWIIEDKTLGELENLYNQNNVCHGDVNPNGGLEELEFGLFVLKLKTIPPPKKEGLNEEMKKAIKLFSKTKENTIGMMVMTITIIPKTLNIELLCSLKTDKFKYIGTIMMEHAIHFANLNRMVKIELQAVNTVVDFYKKLGFTYEDKNIQELPFYTIPMKRILQGVVQPVSTRNVYGGRCINEKTLKVKKATKRETPPQEDVTNSMNHLQQVVVGGSRRPQGLSGHRGRRSNNLLHYDKSP